MTRYVLVPVPEHDGAPDRSCRCCRTGSVPPDGQIPPEPQPKRWWRP